MLAGKNGSREKSAWVLWIFRQARVFNVIMRRMNLEKISGEIPLRNIENKEFVHKKLYHLSSWKDLAALKVGDTFTLTPGPQGAEGNGVYFSENEPRALSSADGVVRSGELSAVVEIPVDSPKGWWRSKGSVVRKFKRPRTWHTDNKRMKLIVNDIKMENGVPHISCEWEWDKEADDMPIH